MSRPDDEVLQQLGATMREIDPSALQPDPDGSQVRWFLGEHGTELFAWFHPGQSAHHVQLVFSRVSVEWSKARGLATGAFQDRAATAGGRYDPYLLTVGSNADPEVCRAALVLLYSAAIEPAVKGPLIAALESAGLGAAR